jgi:peptide/nickel transport system permease protein
VAAGGRAIAWLAATGQGTPVFWVGGLLVAVFGVVLGWLPPGGIAGPTLPAFGTAAYLDALHAHPAPVLGDLAAHLTLPALTLALAGLATDLRVVVAVLPAQLHAPHTRVARAAGLSRGRVAWRAARPTLPVVLGSTVAAAPLLAGAVVLVEYLFGWPGAGLLAYHAARAGDSATLTALLALFGLAVIMANLVADLLAAWADPRLRGPRGAP